VKDYQREFIHFLVEAGALQFGRFTLKSGRESPYFFSSAKFDTGETLARLGYFYACAIQELEPLPSVIYGPAYKGIPLAVAAAIALRQHFDIDAAYCFDRKEAKTHGDAGLFVGRIPTESDRVAMVDDVITDGQTKFEAIERLRSVSQAPLAGMVIALNRQEKTAKGEDPVARLEKSSRVPVLAIATLDDVIAALSTPGADGKPAIDEATQERVRAYREAYGIARHV
jgi:orotate phosphoribosyltransferase